MAVYRGKYILEGLGTICPEMEKNLDEMCGKCCHQPNIVVRPEEFERIAYAANLSISEFIDGYLERTRDGRFLFSRTAPCAFLSKDNRCTIWKDRPEICDDFPYAVSMFMSRVYLALTNPDADILDLIAYMDDTWPCTKVIRSTIKDKIEERRKDIVGLSRA